MARRAATTRRALTRMVEIMSSRSRGSHLEVQTYRFAFFLSSVTLACSAENRTDIAEREFVAEQALRIGSPDDSAAAFTWFRELEVGPNGDVYTYHPQERTLRVHSPDGRLIRTIGREGEGPGEFKGSGIMGMLGDSLWVLDFSTYRFSYFSLNGDFLGSTNVSIDLGSSLEDSPPRPRGLLSDGTMSGSSSAWSHLIADGTITHSAVLRLDSSGALADTIAVYSVENSTWRLTDPNNERSFQSFRPQPFTDTELVQVSDYQPLVVRVDRTGATTSEHHFFRVTAIRFDGDTVFTMEYPYAPLPVQTSLVDSLVAEYAERISRSSLRSAPPQERAEVWARETLYVPEFHPPVSDLRLGRDGSIWLRGEMTGDPNVRWRILDQSGRLLGTMRLPAALRVYHAVVDQVWGMQTDELDVPYIVSYRVASTREGA